MNSFPSTGPILVQADPDLAEMIPGYLDARRADVARVAQALSQGDFGAIEIVGHKMLGTGASYGFEALSDIGGALESAAIAADPKAVQQSLDRLSDYLARV